MNNKNIFLTSLYKQDQDFKSTYKLNMYINDKEELLNTTNTLVVNKLKQVEEFKERFKVDIEYLNKSLNKSIDSLKKAIVGERNFTGYIYTSNIPLTKTYTSVDNTALIKDNIVFGISNTEEIEVVEELTYKNILSDTVNIVPNTQSLNTLNNVTINLRNKNIYDLRLDLRNYKSTNKKLILDLKEHYIIEVLTTDKVVLEKGLKKLIVLDITEDEITIRFHKVKEIDYQIHINKLGVSDQLITNDVIYESIPINVNKELEYICLDICDNNYNNVKIDYYVKINEGEYELFKNNSNYILKDYQNIIKVNKSNLLDMSTITGTKVTEDSYKFYLPETALNGSYTLKSYLENTLNKTTQELLICIKEDSTIIREKTKTQQTDRLFINNKEVTESSILLTKGIHKIITMNATLTSITDINLTYLKTIAKQIFIKELEKQIYVDTQGSYILYTNKDLKEGFNLLTTKEYFTYFKNNKNTTIVDKLQIKANMTSLDHKTYPYISKIILRGI